MIPTCAVLCYPRMRMQYAIFIYVRYYWSE